jgi:hypothetical protein
MPVILSPALVVTPASGETRLSPYIGWDNEVTVGNVSADSSAAGYPVTNLANPSTTNWWLSDITDEQVILISSPDGDIDYVAFADHNFGTSGTSLVIEGQTGDSAPDFDVLAGVDPATDAPLLIRIPKASYIAIRVRLLPDAVAPSAAVLFVGELIIVPTGIPPGYTPLEHGRDVDLVGGRSESGEFLGNIVTGSSLSSATQLRLLPKDWYEAEMRAFVRAANFGDPFFFAWSPVLRPNEVGYCWFDGSAKPVISQSDGSIDISLPLRGIDT